MRVSGSSPPANRFRALDQARGTAVIAMVIYHFCWDLSHFDLIGTDVASAPGWKLFAQGIAASFLFISGLSLWLATKRGIDRRAFFRRLMLVAGAAVLVTLGTFFAFPERYIFFGILHCIAASSLIALAFMRLPAFAALVAGLAILALPQAFSAEAFNEPLLRWLGLGTVAPETNDYVPIFPWAGFVLLGLAAGQVSGRQIRMAPVFGPLWLATLGRWSLPVYLMHQPLLFGGMMLCVQALGLGAGRESTNFVRACTRDCQISGAEAAICSAACSCAGERLQQPPIWRKVLTDTLAPDERAEADAIGRTCYREAVSRPSSPVKP